MECRGQEINRMKFSHRIYACIYSIVQEISPSCFQYIGIRSRAAWPPWSTASQTGNVGDQLAKQPHHSSAGLNSDDHDA